MQGVTLSLNRLACFIRCRWRIIAGLCFAAAGLYAAAALADRQGRRDLQYAYSVRTTCEDDPESNLWRGGCERIARDIARSDRPSFGDLYWAFVAVHHSPTPSQATAGRFANTSPRDSGFDLGSALKGTRYGISPHHFTAVRSLEHAHAIMDEIDKKDRALLLIGRGGLSYGALAAGTLANLTDPVAVLAAAGLLAALGIAGRKAG